MLKTLEQKVRYCLTQFPATRNNDRTLIGAVYAYFYNVDLLDSFLTVIRDDKLPSFESIRRTRQKIQAEDESLRGDKKTEERRMEAQIKYIEYALSE